MGKTWKWILGIVLVLVVIGVLFLIGFAWQHRMIAFGSAPRVVATGSRPAWSTPGQPRVPMQYGDRPGPMMYDRGWAGPMMGGRGWQYPMMHERGFFPFFGGFGILRGLVELVIFLALLYGAYWLGRRNARIALDPNLVAAATAAPAPAADSYPAPEAKPSSAPTRRTKKTE